MVKGFGWLVVWFGWFGWSESVKIGRCKGLEKKVGDLWTLWTLWTVIDGGGAVREGRVGFTRRAEGTPTVFRSDGPLGKRSGMKGSFEARLLFGVAPSDHEMLFATMSKVLHIT